jgi:hypothetical protein
MMKPKLFPVLEMAVEDGVAHGLNRAHKHTDNPTHDQIVVAVTEAVLNSICEWFDLDQDQEN